MPISNIRSKERLLFLGLVVAALTAACGGSVPKATQDATSLASVPAIRLSYKYEADVPAPELPSAAVEERNAAIQSDFDSNRPGDMLERTLVSPDKKHAFAVYRNASDRDAEFRLDAYSIDGKLLKKVTSDAMAVHFPDTIKWSPDSNTLAFVAMTRAITQTGPLPAASPLPSPPPIVGDAYNANVADPGNTEATPAPVAAATPVAPTGILTFGSEQIYICGSGGEGVKPITQNPGLIYFYYAWSPDSTMLAAMAVTSREWEFYDGTAAMKGESWTPVGRLRIVEKNGRERRLDDNLTAVRPAFSPDSTKISTAYDTQVRIYDAVGTAPTQAGIPLKNQLLISSQTFDRELQRKQLGMDTNSVDVNANGNANSNTNMNVAAAPTPDQPLTTLPDEKTLVSFNPIVDVEWTADGLVYFETAFIKRLKNDAESVTSYARWHRLILSGQPAAPQK